MLGAERGAARVAAGAAFVAFAAVDGRRVHREAVEALFHEPRAPKRRALRAGRGPGTTITSPRSVVPIVVPLAHVAGRGARGAPPPDALGSAALAECLAGASREAPGCARGARCAARLRLAPAGLAREAHARAGGADLARVAGVAINLVRRVGSRWAGEAVDAEGRIGPLLAGRAHDLIAEQNLGLATRARRAGRRTERRVSARRTVVAAHRARPGAEGVDGAERAARRAVLARVGSGRALRTRREPDGAVAAGAAPLERRRARRRRAGAWSWPRRRRGGWRGRRRG